MAMGMARMAGFESYFAASGVVSFFKKAGSARKGNETRVYYASAVKVSERGKPALWVIADENGNQWGTRTFSTPSKVAEYIAIHKVRVQALPVADATAGFGDEIITQGDLDRAHADKRARAARKAQRDAEKSQTVKTDAQRIADLERELAAARAAAQTAPSAGANVAALESGIVDLQASAIR